MPPSLRLGKYVVEGLLGPGGVTETYLVRLAPGARGESAGEMAGHLFALKLLRSDRVPTDAYAEVARRFVDAGRQLRDFHRPGFGQVVDLSDDPAATFVVTEYVSGYDLGRLVELSRGVRQDGALVGSALVGLIGSEIARFLHVGHSAKPILCHLGLAPQNVIVTEAGEIRLMDSGLASAIRAITEQPPERWAFVAPELQGVDTTAVGLRDRQGIAADLYSLGALLHFLVTGRAPAASPTPTRPPRREPATLPDIPGVSGSLGAALRTMLSSEPEDRPESAAVLVDWLASGIDAARDRRQCIAEGLRATEAGGVRASDPSRADRDRNHGEAPQVKTPVPASGNAEDGRSTGTPAASWRRGLAIAAGLVLAALVAALLTHGPWSGQNRAQAFRNGNRGRTRIPEMRPGSPGSRAEPARTRQGQGPGAPAPTLAESVLSRVAGHLIVETVPPGAAVWVDGAFEGRTFADIVVGGGGHRIVLIEPGYYMFRDAVDTTRGAIVRRTLVPIAPPIRGDAFVDVECGTVGKFPVLLDAVETGLLCPARMIPTSVGKHMVGVFVPREAHTVQVETTVEIGSKPAVVTFSQ